jgi:hypothetical protein
MPKVCFWATSFQADNQALAHYLAAVPGFEVVVALDQPERYLREPVCRLIPFRGRLLDREARSTAKTLKQFGPDIFVFDNHLPPFALAPRCLALWHGFGWRVDDLGTTRKKLRRLVGDVTRPNVAFRWSAFGDWDRQYRISHTGLAEQNVVAMGSPYSDLLLSGSDVRERFSRAEAAAQYRVDVARRRTVTLGLTWHHGGPLAHWGDGEALLERLVRHIGELGANVLLRMHDRHRYERRDVCHTEGLEKRFPHLQVKFKSDYPDSLIDLLVTDVMVSNYSSLLNAFYYTGRPTVHIDPFDATAKSFVHRAVRNGKLRKMCVHHDAAQQWKLDPGEIGGLRASSFDELFSAVERALGDERCCEQRAADFCLRYIFAADGRTRQRFRVMLERWM